jgi:outer membrane protein
VNHAQEAFDLAQARYQAGSSSIVELSQAQLELTSAQIAQTSSRYDVLIQESDVNYQIGGLFAAQQSGNPSHKRPNQS